MPRRDTAALAVIPEHRAQPRRGQRLSAMSALGDDEQCISVSFGAFSQQIGLDRAGHVSVDRHRTFFAALTEHPTAASAHRSLGHASYGSCPAAPQTPPATNRAATGAVHGPATVNATSASPCAPTARNAHCAN